MPYIKRVDRSHIDELGVHAVNNAGELNYLLTKIFIAYFNKKDKGNYQAINDIVGAGHGAVAEFQRRLVGPYEDDKIYENGDVYPKQERVIPEG